MLNLWKAQYFERNYTVKHQITFDQPIAYLIFVVVAAGAPALKMSINGPIVSWICGSSLS